MKNIYMIAAGAIMTTAACTEDKEELQYPALYVQAPVNVVAAPQVQNVKVRVVRSSSNVQSAMQCTLSASKTAWKSNAANISYITAMMGDIEINDTQPAEMPVTIAAGESYSEVVINISTSTLLTGRDTALLKLSVYENGSRICGAQMQIAGGAHPLSTAPALSRLEGRSSADTIWFGINEKYYATQPSADEYKVEVKVNSAPYCRKDDWSRFLSSDNKKLGVAVPNNSNASWSVGDTITIRMVIGAQNNDGNSAADTLYMEKFVVKPDNLPSREWQHKFVEQGMYYAALSNKRIASSSGAAAAAETDAVFYIDTMWGRTSNDAYVLKMMGSEDSCKIAVKPSDANHYNNAKRTTDGAQDTMSNSTTADEITIGEPNGIGVQQPSYYAVKIEAYKAVPLLGADGKPVLDANKKQILVKVPVTYYGYLRLRTITHGNNGEPYEFSRVEFSLKYGEARDYQKE